ncbi:F-box protein CPR1-like [Coffea eugenioides]|uniref:F-box protein CPR1-like n=1 Tax=Coffea eugenioides TaxID=49369 RepID=UPI000F606789|nr:F-box protein CPR1-like [Coffea eugenioides]
MANSLPEDALAEILVKLPVKTLLRFCCVSKTWFALINSPYFEDKHLKYLHSKNRKVVLVKRFIKNEFKTLLSFHSHDEDESLPSVAPNIELPSWNRYSFDIYGACNGIVCFSDLSEIHLCNPATRQFLTLPPSLRFDPPKGFKSVSPHALGFGFDPSTQDYKVVKLYKLYPKSRSNYSYLGMVMGVQIYKLCTNSWRKVDLILPQVVNIYPPCFPATVNGCFHWDASDIDPESGSVMRNILSFNMCTEVFRKIEYPSDARQPHVRPDVFVLDGDLAAISIKFPYLPFSSLLYEETMDIWVMMEYGVKESWIKKFSLQTPMAGLNLPLSSWNDDKLLLLQRVGEDGCLISRSLRDNSQAIMKYDIFGTELTLRAIVYQETLVSLSARGDGLSWRNMDDQPGESESY